MDLRTYITLDAIDMTELTRQKNQAEELIALSFKLVGSSESIIRDEL